MYCRYQTLHRHIYLLVKPPSSALIAVDAMTKTRTISQVSAAPALELDLIQKIKSRRMKPTTTIRRTKMWLREVLTSIRSSSNRCAVLKEPAKPEKPEEVVVQKPPTPSTKAPKETAQHTPSSTPSGRDENQLRPNGRQHWLLALVNLVNKLPRLFYLLVQSKSLCLRGAFHHDIVVQVFVRLCVK